MVSSMGTGGIVRESRWRQFRARAMWMVARALGRGRQDLMPSRGSHVRSAFLPVCPDFPGVESRARQAQGKGRDSVTLRQTVLQITVTVRPLFMTLR
jgi:hypothetical protein